MRAYLETENAPDTGDYLRQVLAWLQAHRIRDELEPEEASFIDAHLGAVGQKQLDQAFWRSEGLAVLAWALGLFELPPHDVEADQQVVSRSLGFMREPLAFDAELRAEDELARYQRLARTIHWRLREFGLRPKAIDFAAVAAQPAFAGRLDLEGVPLLDGDLAIAKAPIGSATQGAVIHATSIAGERHQAINWLLGDATRYTDVDTAT